MIWIIIDNATPITFYNMPRHIGGVYDRVLSTLSNCIKFFVKVIDIKIKCGNITIIKGEQSPDMVKVKLYTRLSMNTKILNTDESLELALYAENDYDVYTNAIMPVVRCLQKKFKAGTFDMAKAHKAFVNVAVFAAKKYAADFGGVYYRMFSPSDRRLTAASLLDTYMEDITADAEE